MLYCDLLRLTVLLAAATATVLAAVTVIGTSRTEETLPLLVAAGWWPLATLGGILLGRPRRAAEAMRPVLAAARTDPTLPAETPTRTAIGRLWPIGAFTLVVGGIGLLWPGVATVGAGYSLGAALAWRTREAAVHAVEERDGVRFYVEPGSALSPVRLVRTPGLGRDRDPADRYPAAG